MKKLFYLITFLSGAIVLGNIRPDKVPSKITELRSKSWYQEIAQSWEQYLSNNSSEEYGWIDLYKASSYAGQSKEKLSGIVDQVKVQFPESFTSYYLSFKLEGWSDKGVQHLNRARDLDPANIYALEDYLALMDLKDKSGRRNIAKEVYDTGLIHASTLNYNYNLLMSVSEDGVLLTEALHTTIPIWVLQDVMNVRPDVSIINLELARSSEAYVSNILSAKNLNASVDQLLKDDNEIEIFYALTLPRKQLQDIENHLYVVGLASTNGNETFNHFEALRENIEEKFLLDYLSIDFNGDPKTATGNVLSSNYIVPMLLLKEFYDNLNNETRSDEITDQILALADNSQIKTRVELLLNSKKTPRTFKIVDIDAKKYDKRMKQIKNELYASEVELSNKEFWFFMEYLRTNDYSELFESCKPDLKGYDDLTKALLFKYQYSPANAQSVENERGGNYLDYPVLDISYETAKAYCEWLTVQYNGQEKRKFKKVVFRLPSKEEWTIAALGYKDFQSWNLNENTVMIKGDKKGEEASYSLSEYTVSYPWFTYWKYRNSIKNSKDCYLANVKVPENVTCAAGIKGDGYTFVSPIGTYFSNGFGLYDVIGNVAEMTEQRGQAMGGSWNHSADESTIQSVYTYDKKDISVGFRLFMEVIEE